ncbi:hypothetical protein ScPMuIL_006386 [Solemya velum]
MIQAGDVKAIYLDEGTANPLLMKTLSLKPLLFEIHNVLNAEECAHFINVAKEKGLQKSITTNKRPEHERFVLADYDQNQELSVEEMRWTIEGSMDIYLDDEDILEMYRKTNVDKNEDGIIDEVELKSFTPKHMQAYLSDFLKNQPEKHSRFSEQLWLFPRNSTDEVFQSLQKRISKVTELAPEIIKKSDFQVVRYDKKGHYNAHYDSTRKSNLPCCVEEHQGDCRICRFMTALAYLNDVEEGGETAFPVADNETVNVGVIKDKQLLNLNKYCDRANLKIKPELGKLVIWYNHFLDPDTDWLGEMDRHSIHGGCSVTSGEKWIANFWITASHDKEKDLEQMFKTLMKDEL